MLNGTRIFIQINDVAHLARSQTCPNDRNLHRAPADISQALARLERKGLLLSQGQSKGKVQHLPGAGPVPPEQAFCGAISSGSNAGSSGSKAASSGSSAEAASHV